MRRLHRALLSAPLFFAVLSVSPRVESQASDVDARARSTFQAGRAAFEDGRFDEALGLYEHAYRTSPRPELLFNIGRAAEESGDSERALEAYSAYLDALPGASNRGYVAARVRRLRASQGTPQRSARASAKPERSDGASLASTFKRTPSVGKVRLYGGIGFAFMGNAPLPGDYADEGDTYVKLRPSSGFQLGVGFVWRLFGITAEARWSRLRISRPDYDGYFDDDYNGSALLVVIKPRLGYQFQQVPLELYFALPHGGGYSGVGESEGGEVTVGLLGGASYFFRDWVALNGELGPEWTIFRAYGTRPTLRLNAMLRF